jgi:hypothetical protein
MTKSKEAATTERKLTAAQVEENCPAALQDLGKRIAAHFDKARKYQEKAEQHYTAIAQHLAKAKEACDAGGFNAFREKFFPELGRTRTYELLAIATNKKSVEETKAGTRKRVAKHRAKKAGASVTVTDKLAPEAEGVPTEVAPADAHNIVPEQTPEAAKPRRAVTPKDEALFDFTARVCELIRVTRGQKLKRFAAAAVKADELAKLGKFLTDLANLKKGSAKPTATVPGNDTVSAERSAEDVKAKRAAREASGDQTA